MMNTLRKKPLYLNGAVYFKGRLSKPDMIVIRLTVKVLMLAVQTIKLFMIIKKDWKLVPNKTYIKNGKPNHLSLMKVKSENSTGFMAVNSMAKLKDGSVGESIYFCLIHDNNALCGSGYSAVTNSGEELSKKILRLLESISFDVY